MPFPIAAAIGASIFTGLLGARSADKAADAQTNASNASIAEQRRQYDLTRSDYAPYMNIGTQALNALGAMYGYTPSPVGGQPQLPLGGANPYESELELLGVPRNATRSGSNNILGRLIDQIIDKRDQYAAANPPVPGVQPINAGAFGGQTAPNYTNFFASPDYNFRRTEGLRGIEQTAAARGGALSGNALRGITDFNSNLAAEEFGNYFNRQASLAGIGQAATNANASFGAGASSNIGNALLSAGDARASGILGKGAAASNAIGGITEALILKKLTGG